MSHPTEDSRLAARERPKASRRVMYQRWDELLFLHWAFEVSTIQQSLPRGLAVDTFQGKAYLGIVPFFMRNIRPPLCPAVWGISNFLELNLRTYVYDKDGLPGVWFYSLDANQQLAVRLARRFFHLPYFYATMRAEKNNQTEEVTYSSHRRGTREDLDSHFRYRASGRLREAKPGTLEFFLIERYVLFAHLSQTSALFRGRVHHSPYLIANADGAEWTDLLFELDGFERPRRTPDHVVVSPGVDVEVFGVERVM